MWNASLHSNLNFPAPVSVLGLLAAGCGMALIVLGAATAFFMRKPKFAALLLRLASVGAAVYLCLLLVFSFASHETNLAAGQEKYFCEIDCHLAYSVSSLNVIPYGNSLRYRITLRTRFDETTISSHRPKDAPLIPNARTARLLDAQDSEYEVTGSTGTPLTTPLIPGQSYITELEFVVPQSAGVTNMRLLLTTTPYWDEAFQIGDENSFLHKKTYFSL